MRLALIALTLLTAAPVLSQTRLSVRPEPGTPVVTAELLLALGPADEPEGQAGIAYLTARSAVAPIRPVLDSLGARLTVDVRKDAITFAITAAPDVWEETSRLLLVSVFRDPVDSAAVVRQRTAIAEELRARETSPSDELVRRLDQSVFGEGHPWARPAVGTAEAVREIAWTDVDVFLRDRFTANRAVMAVIGPVQPEEVEAHLASFMGEGGIPQVEVLPPAPADTTVHVEYSSITAWVGVSYAFGAETDMDGVRLLADLVLDRVSFGPSRRSVYDSRSQVLRYAGGGGELRITLVVPPREAAVWADRIREAVATYVDQDLAAGPFNERLRRFRGRRLLELDSPEARVDALSRAVLVGGIEDPLAAGRGLTPARLQEIARSLRSPVVVLLGPFEGDDE
jgi:zinc protease